MLFEQQRIDGSDIESLTPQENRKVLTVNAGCFQSDLYFVRLDSGQGRKQRLEANRRIEKRERPNNLFLLIQDTAVMLFRSNVNANIEHSSNSFVIFRYRVPTAS